MLGGPAQHWQSLLLAKWADWIKHRFHFRPPRPNQFDDFLGQTKIARGQKANLAAFLSHLAATRWPSFGALPISFPLFWASGFSVLAYLITFTKNLTN